MEQKSNFRLGLFILSAILIGALLMIGLGSGRWFNKQFILETYFNESVQGLDLGSKVRYRGVVVGEVSAITFTYARYQQALPNAQRNQYVLIEMRLASELFGSKKLSVPLQEVIDAEIAKGLRVKIAPQGLTGTSYLEIDYLDAKTSRQLPFDWQAEHLYIPSAPSTVNQIVNGAQDLLGKLQKLDIERTLNRIDNLLATAQEKIDPIPLANMAKKTDQVLGQLAALPMQQIASEAAALIAETRQSNQALQTVLAQPGWLSAPADLALAAQSARRVLDDPALASSVQRIDKITQRLDRLSLGREREIGELIDNLNGASISLQSLLEKADRQPSQLLFADPPAPYTPPKP